MFGLHRRGWKACPALQGNVHVSVFGHLAARHVAKPALGTILGGFWTPAGRLLGQSSTLFRIKSEEKSDAKTSCPPKVKKTAKKIGKQKI